MNTRYICTKKYILALLNKMRNISKRSIHLTFTAIIYSLSQYRRYTNDIKFIFKQILGGAILKKCAQKGPLITAWLFFENHKPEP